MREGVPQGVEYRVMVGVGSPPFHASAALHRGGGGGSEDAAAG